jgi:hypothetical protein
LIHRRLPIRCGRVQYGASARSLEAALAQFAAVAESLGESGASGAIT